MKKFFLAAIVAIMGVMSVSAQSGVLVVRPISGVEKNAEGHTFMVVDGRKYPCEVADYLTIKNDTAGTYQRVAWTGDKPFHAVAKAGEAKVDTLIVSDVRLDSLDNVILSFKDDSATPKFTNPEWGKVRTGDTVIRYSLNCSTMRFTRYETLKANAEAKRKHEELVAANRAAREADATN